MRALAASVIFFVLLCGYFAFADTRTLADQGAPGKYGPWPVTMVILPDGGFASSYAYPGPCAATATDAGSTQQVTSVGTSAGVCPALQDPNRKYIVYCNSIENSGTPIVKIRIDGTAPVIGIATAGDALMPGDCITYPIAGTAIPSCIANAAATAVTTFQCRAP